MSLSGPAQQKLKPLACELGFAVCRSWVQSEAAHPSGGLLPHSVFVLPPSEQVQSATPQPFLLARGACVLEGSGGLAAAQDAALKAGLAPTAVVHS